MKKTFILPVAIMTLFMSQMIVQAIDVSPYQGAAFESSIINGHDMQLLNKRRFEVEEARQYQSEKKAKQAQEDLNNKLQEYQNSIDNYNNGMQFIQNSNGSIIIKQGNSAE